MFSVQGKQQFGGVWLKGKLAVTFKNGKGFTDDADTAEELRQKGYTIIGEADSKPLHEMKTDELKAYAAVNGIDLGEATKKADILKIIQEAENQQ